jgi:hypothetical protein
MVINLTLFNACMMLIKISSVYYRVYTEDGAVMSKSSSETGDPSLGRILGRSVAPPHTVASLKKRLRDAEGVADHGRLELYLSCAAHSPMDDKSRISLLSGTGPGSFQQEPVALVVSNAEADGFKDGPEFANSVDNTDTTPESELRYRMHSLH